MAEAKDIGVRESLKEKTTKNRKKWADLAVQQIYEKTIEDHNKEKTTQKAKVG